MKITTSATVTAAPDRVFAALNDPAVLQRCIPGCDSLTEIDGNTFAVTLKLGLAGIKGTYQGTAARRDVRAPEAFTLAFDGKGKAGFVRGTAAIRIRPERGISRVDCEADVQAGGPIAAVGSRLMGAAARKLTADFFRKLAETIGATFVPDGEAEETSDPAIRGAHD